MRGMGAAARRLPGRRRQGHRLRHTRRHVLRDHGRDLRRHRQQRRRGRTGHLHFQGRLSVRRLGLLQRQVPSRRRRPPAHASSHPCSDNRRGIDHPAAAGGGLQRSGAGDGPCVGCDGCDAVRRAHQRSRHRRKRHRLPGDGHGHRRAVREPGCGGEDAGQHVGRTGLDGGPDAGGRRPERHR